MLDAGDTSMNKISLLSGNSQSSGRDKQVNIKQYDLYKGKNKCWVLQKHKG